ncbi:S-adenosyl-L-methionine-dependent methyltransferase [Acephala macrosclerotiorum]|nr:S-adenosyl-L-methionine-dependent methyltransferase [Acephala macrosclerotiorum]
MASKKEIYVFSKRDEEESSRQTPSRGALQCINSCRLNFQDAIALKVSNGMLVHPFIPLSSLKAVADIGTGTGIWLDELQPQVSPETRLDGFDMSAAQFSAKSKGTFILQNFLEPFPAEYHGLYDLAHIRYMVVALKGWQYRQAIENLITIIKPGGHLQWDDFDYERFITVGPPAPVHNELHELGKRFLIGVHMSIHCSREILDGMKQEGLEDVVRDERNSYWYTSLAVDAQRWAWWSFDEIIEKALVWSGTAKDEETAAKMTKEKLDSLEEEYQGGVVPNFPQRIVIGRKPLSG